MKEGIEEDGLESKAAVSLGRQQWALAVARGQPEKGLSDEINGSVNYEVLDIEQG